MRKCSFWSFLLSLSLAFSTEAAASVERKFDRFNNKTAVILLAEFGTASHSSRPSLIMISDYDGETPQGTAVVFMMSLSFVRDSWKYLECPSVSMLIDGEPTALPDFKHDGSVGNGYVIERLKAGAPIALARKLAGSKSVEIKVCNDEFQMPTDFSTDAKKFLEMLGDDPKKKSSQKGAKKGGTSK